MQSTSVSRLNLIDILLLEDYDSFKQIQIANGSARSNQTAIVYFRLLETGESHSRFFIVIAIIGLSTPFGWYSDNNWRGWAVRQRLMVSHLRWVTMQTRSYKLVFRVLACFVGVSCFALPSDAAPRSEKLLKATVSEDAALNSSLKVLTQPSVPKFVPQGSFSVPAGLIQTQNIGGNPKSFLRSAVDTADRIINSIYEKNRAADDKTKSNDGKPRSRDDKTKSNDGKTKDALPANSVWNAPGYEAILRPKPPTKTSLSSDKAPPATNVDKSKETKTTVSTPPSIKGVTSWKPGYETKKVPTLPANTKDKNTAAANTATTATVAPGPEVLTATPLLLPELRSKTEDENLDWNGWYKQIGKACYSRWQGSEVGPGIATVRVTVTQTRDVSCRLIDFTPAEGIDRNVVAEKKFREAAVRAVNNVRPFEIPKLPPLMERKKVVFDVELRRTVDGPAGFHISPVNSPSGEDGQKSFTASKR